MIPLFDPAKAQGKRNKLDCIAVQHSGQYCKHHFTSLNYVKAPVAWPEGVIKFIDDRALAVGKQNSQLFYPSGVHPHGDPLGTGSLTESNCDTCLCMRTCPTPLPTKSKSTAHYFTTDAKWLRGWHGASAYSLKSILYEGKLRPGPRQKQEVPAVYLHVDKTKAKAEGYSVWMPLFNDG